MSSPTTTTVWRAVSPSRVAVLLAVGMMSLAAISIAGRAWWAAGRGFDITDEGMYLSWLTAPHDWPWSSTQFAFIYGPLWWLTGQDLVLTRRVSIMITCVAAWAFLAVTLRRGLRVQRRAAIAIGGVLSVVACIGIGSVGLFAVPNYNLLGLQGILLAGTALVAVLVDSRDHRLWPWALMGVAGVVCFASRPTAGALLLVILLASLLLAKRWWLPGIGVAAAVALATLLLLAVLIDRNPAAFVERVFEGLHLYSLQTARSPWDAVVNTFTFETPWSGRDLVVGGLLAATLLALLVLAGMKLRRPPQSWPLLLTAGCCLALSASAVWVAVKTPLVLSLVYSRMAVVGLALTAAAVMAVCFREVRPSRSHTVAAMGVGLLPFAYSFGTYWSTIALAGTASVCWLGASILLMDGTKRPLSACLSSGAVWLLATAMGLSSSMEATPRQPPLPQQSTDFELAGRATVKMSDQTVAYLSGIQAAAHEAGFNPGMPVLDLTGESPGLVYHLRARATADPWVIGYYTGSQDRLHRQLTVHTDCQVIGRSWLLVTPDGFRRIDSNVLHSVGQAFPDDYIRVAEMQAPDASRGYRTQLWRPRHPEVGTAACESLR